MWLTLIHVLAFMQVYRVEHSQLLWTLIKVLAFMQVYRDEDSKVVDVDPRAYVHAGVPR